MWLLDRFRSWRDWLCTQLAASVATQVQAAFLEDAADCAVSVEMKAKKLDELGLKNEAEHLRRQIAGMLAATPPTLASPLPQTQDNGAGEQTASAPRKSRRSLTQEDLYDAKRS
jgi:hypothetical protein